MNLWAPKQKQTGFTIVELLVVIVVIAILAAVIIVAFNGVQNRAKVASLKSDLRNAKSQLEVAKVTDGGYPAGADGLQKSENTTYQYTKNADGSYCLTATDSTADVGAFHVSNNGAVVAGACPGDQESTVVDGSEVALDCPDGFVSVPGNSKFGTSDFCAMKYEAKNVGGVAVSQAAGKPWVDLDRSEAQAAAQTACDGCHLITEAEWLTIAHNVLNVDSNWSGGSVGSGALYNGYNSCWFSFDPLAIPASNSDSDGYAGTGATSGNQRRTLTLSNGEVIWDMSANAQEWVAPRASTGMPSPGDYEWYEWNDLTDSGSITPNPFPSYGTPAAASWGSAQGLGRVLSGGSGTSYVRSGYCADGDNAGVFYMNFNFSPTYSSVSVGFRAAK